ncbi:protein adenylyltransferase SelO family protein, partial [Bradyrhizobium sp. DOA1]|uniref:protein adenylyltransferase SelO family protein n=1 Tax=Bradyrhizobium sp. DOA1 TaxID=1126616 RepID=UPI001FDA00E0
MYVTGSDAWSSQNQCRRKRIERPETTGPKLRQGLPDEDQGGNQGNGLILDPTGPFPAYQRPSLCHQAFQPYLKAMTVHFPFQNSYSALPDSFFARVAPTPVAAPRLIKLNRLLALQLGLDPDLLETPEGAEILAGKTVPAGADPIAMAYAGHQFGHFVPQLG